MKISTARLCPGCDLPLTSVAAKRGYSAYCPRCNSQLYRGGSSRFSGELAIAIACLLLFIPSHFFPLITIKLFGVMIPATLPSGTITLMKEGFPFLGLLILFCSSIAPLLLCGSVVTAQWSLTKKKFRPFKYSLWVLQHFKAWVMLDVFLVSFGIACFKVQDHADIFVGSGLLGLVLLQLMTSLLLTRVSVRRYWEAWQTQTPHACTDESIHCKHCHMSQPPSEQCVRCDSHLHKRSPRSLQKTWAYLIAAAVFVLPANLYPISILLTNGKRLEDTILSGVAGLVRNDMTGIAIIIFVASIIVPVAKILGLSYILMCIRIKRRLYHRQRMIIYFSVKWIGKWSVMDLFVVSIMMTLIDRGQILDFTPGPGAIAFGLVVLLTMLAAESLDSRLIWDNYEQPKRN